MIVESRPIDRSLLWPIPAREAVQIGSLIYERLLKQINKYVVEEPPLAA